MSSDCLVCWPPGESASTGPSVSQTGSSTKKSGLSHFTRTSTMLAILLSIFLIAGCDRRLADTAGPACDVEAAATFSAVPERNAGKACDTINAVGPGCIGESADNLPEPRYAHGDMLFYKDATSVLAVTVVDGRIGRVARVYQSGGCVTSRGVLAILEDRLGKGEDRCYFPADETDDRSRAGAISSGTARGQRCWRQRAGWTTRLTWTGKVIMLEVEEDELARRVDDLRRARSLAERLRW